MSTTTPRHTHEAPFEVDILHAEADAAASLANSRSPKSPTRLKNHVQLLPAAFRSPQNHLIIPIEDLESIYGFLNTELSTERLNKIHSWLLIVGRPTPPRPLHHQLLIGRNIMVTEQAELHLVWAKHRIFIKPLPKYLLDLKFWSDYLVCPEGVAQSTGSGSSLPEMYGCKADQACRRRAKLAALARGFLFSYAALISHESDFRIAIAHGLVPDGITWDNWRLFVAQLLESHTYAAVNPRYWYGELRLSRLNKIYRFRYGRIFRAYSTVSFYDSSGDFFADNLGKLAAFLGYVVIVLTAMQVGLATDKLQPDVTFQRASYGFTVFSIIAPLLALGIICIVFVCLSFSNWTDTRVFQRKRFQEMGVGCDDE